MIRLITLEDTDKVLAVYSPYVTSTPITFEYDIPSSDAFRNRILSVTKQFPWLICEIDNEIAGYAYASPQHERAAYQWNAELSIYVSGKYHGKRIGTALYNALIALLKQQGYYNVYACITLPNEKSLALHKSFGFTKAGTFLNTGNKFNTWYDVVWLVKQIHAYDRAPRSPVPICSLDTEILRKILLQNEDTIIK